VDGGEHDIVFDIVTENRGESLALQRGEDVKYNMLFDEKMGDTIHLALGRAYKDNVGEDREQNLSAVHLDMIVDMSENSYIEIDGEKVQENGNFIFE
jgi:aminopeptidase